MPAFVPGIIMKKIRKEKGFSQAEVCHGYCTTATYSRIENGVQTPTMYLFAGLMERLGCDYRKFYLDVQSIEGYDLHNDMESIINLIRKSKYEEASGELKKLENKYMDDLSNATTKKGGEHKCKEDSFEKKYMRQFFLGTKGVIEAHLKTGECDALGLLHEALHITSKDITEDNICSFLLSENEITYLNQIANMYARNNEYDKAIKILNQLKKNIEIYYTDEAERFRIYALIVYNLTKYLATQDNYEEIVAICNEGIDLCVRNNPMRLLPHLLTNKACGMYHIGNEKDSKEAFKEAYYCARAYKDYKTAKSIKENAMLLYKIDVE